MVPRSLEESINVIIGSWDLTNLVEMVMTKELDVNDDNCIKIPACPWLPGVEGIHDHSLTRRHGAEKGEAFYQDALRFAQSHWLSGKPAQAILQLNKAWMSDLAGDDPVLAEFPPPYRALVWILRESAAGGRGFLGNPVRHFQHLASRVSGPRAEVRSWRAWVCFHLAERVLDRSRFPRDGVQLAKEGLWIPGFHRSCDEVARRGWSGEVDAVRLAWGDAPEAG